MAEGQQNGGMAEWRNGGMAELWNGGMAEWRNGRMPEWWNGGMAELRNGGIAEWRNSGTADGRANHGMAAKLIILWFSQYHKLIIFCTTNMVTNKSVAAKPAAISKKSPIKVTTPPKSPNPYNSSPKKKANEKKNPTTLFLWWITMEHHMVGHLKTFITRKILSKTFPTGRMR
jgi:hypothetical protein